MNGFKKSILMGGMIATLLLPTSGALAAIISFDDDGGLSGGTISYDGASGPLIGTNILFHSIVGTGTVLNDGVVLDCNGCLLNFSSGSNTGENPWTWNAGGIITITGNITDPTNFDAVVVAQGTLATGSFVNNNTTSVTGVAPILNFSAIGIDSKAQGLVDYYGESNPFDFSATSIQLGTAVVDPLTFAFNATVTNADFDNLSAPAAVPEPGTMMLMGSGLLGLGLWRKFKK